MTDSGDQQSIAVSAIATASAAFNLACLAEQTSDEIQASTAIYVAAYSTSAAAAALLANQNDCQSFSDEVS